MQIEICMIHYNTDTGNRESGDPYAKGQVRLGDQSGPRAITDEQAFTLIQQLPGQPMLLAKTIKWGAKPGGYYAKAFASEGANWEELLQIMQNNQASGLHTMRNAWVCRPGQPWV